MLWTIVTPHSNVQCYSRLVNKDRCFVVTWVILYLCNIKAVNVLKGSYMSLSTFQRATTMWGIDKVSFQLKSLHYKQIIGKWLTSRKWEMLVGGGDVWFLPSDNKSLPLLSVNSNIVSVSKFQSSFNKSYCDDPLFIFALNWVPILHLITIWLTPSFYLYHI